MKKFISLWLSTLMIFMMSFGYSESNPTTGVIDNSQAWYFSYNNKLPITDVATARAQMTEPMKYGYLYSVDIGNGNLFTGWYLDLNDNYHYFDAAGHAVTDQWVGDYFLLKDGMLAKNTWIGNYYVDSNGKYQPNAIQYGWENTAKGWRFKKSNGQYAIGWYQIEWVDSPAASANGVINYNSTIAITKTLFTGLKYWYYFNDAGYMLSDCWVGDYFVGKDGVMYTNTWVPDSTGVGKWYVDVSGKWVPGQASEVIVKNNVIINRTENAGSAAYKIVNGQQVALSNEWYNNRFYNEYGFLVKDQWVGDYLVDANGDKVTKSSSLWTGGFYIGYRESASAAWNNKHATAVSPIDNNKYFIKTDGTAISNTWIYCTGTNNFAAGWYYVGANYMLVKNNWVDGIYYLGTDGKMLTNTWINNYFVGNDGRLIQ